MNEIIDIVTKIGIEFHESKIKKLCERLSVLEVKEFTIDLSDFFGIEKTMINELITMWKRFPQIPKLLIVGALLGSKNTATQIEENQDLQLVWTGPDSEIVPSRSTRQVMLDLIVSAKEEIFIVSFVAYDINQLIEELKNASERGVKIKILLERSKQDGGNVNNDSFAVFKKSIPTAILFQWMPENSPASVHAKCFVTDRKTAFITSANLTETAMDRNMEIGILISGGELPDKLSRHLNSLILTKTIHPL